MYSYNGRLIGSHTWAFDWYQFRWPWMILNDRNATPYNMCIQLSLSLHFYLLNLLLNSCNGNDAFWRHSVLVKQSSFFSWKHRTLSLRICVRQTVRLTIEFVDWCRNVCTLYKQLSATLAAVTSDFKQRLIGGFDEMEFMRSGPVCLSFYLCAWLLQK